MFAQHEGHHRLEHRDLDSLTPSGAGAPVKRRQDGVDASQPYRPVDECERNIAWPVITGRGDQRRQADGALNQVVIRGPGCIGTVLAEACQDGVYEAGIAIANVVPTKVHAR